MKVVHYEQIAAAAVDTEGAAGCRIRCLIGPDDRAPSFTMRHFEIDPGGYTPEHAHGHEHEVFILEGTGVVREGGQEHPLRPGTVVFVPPQRGPPVPQYRHDPALLPLLDSASLAGRRRRVSAGLRLRMNDNSEVGSRKSI